MPEPTLHGNDETTYRNVLTDTCDIVGDYIKELVGRLEWLEMSIEDKEPTEFVEIIRPYFGRFFPLKCIDQMSRDMRQIQQNECAQRRLGSA